jgi:hypothetical protein
MEGFVGRLSDVYSRNSILLAPSFLAGGLKTKITEALAYGVIPLANDVSFESLGCDNSSLVMPLPELARVPRIVNRQISAWTEAARQLQEQMRSMHGIAEHRRKWNMAIGESNASHSDE